MPRIPGILAPAVFGLLALVPSSEPAGVLGAIMPGTRVVLDAHNAYPYQGRWADRLDRALSLGTPIAIEQDLVWHAGRSIVSHGEPVDGSEPTLDRHFFERIRPVVEDALRRNQRGEWPLITLNLDFKTNEPEHHRAVWAVLGRYEGWLTTALRTGSIDDVSSLNVAPVLVLTGDDDAQERSFHDTVAIGSRLRLFGAVRRTDAAPRRSNYRRWANYSWKTIEPEGQPKAGAWTRDDRERLQRLVSSAHAAGLWIRLYTLNGHAPADRTGGWSEDYNFGSLDRVRERWRAAIRARVDFVAVDQYEAFADVLRTAATIIEGQLTRGSYESISRQPFDVPAGTRRFSSAIHVR